MVESEEWIRYCLQKNGAYIDTPLGWIPRSSRWRDAFLHSFSR